MSQRHKSKGKNNHWNENHRWTEGSLLEGDSFVLKKLRGLGLKLKNIENKIDKTVSKMYTGDVEKFKEGRENHEKIRRESSTHHWSSRWTR